jgi:outer membrane biosynthesis protein TonB
VSTAEITFSVGELATERRQEARKIVWAVLAALVIHVIIGFLLAILSTVQTVPMPEEDDKPVEMTIVDSSFLAPPKPKNAEFIETDPSRQTAEAPKEKTFESNANSIAASEAAPSGNMPLPSQDGKDRPGLELDNQNYTLPNQGAQPQTAAAPQPTTAPQASTTPQPTATPIQATTPAPTAAPDQFAMLTRTPTPPPQVATPAPASQRTAAPQQPNSAYRPERQKTRIGGNISNRGISSVNALGTPLGRYQKIVTDAIGSRWYAYTQSRGEMMGIGTFTVHFWVDRSGKIQNLKVISNTSNETFANICLQSILDAKLPPIPEDVAATLPPEGLEWDGINFIIYPN